MSRRTKTFTKEVEVTGYACTPDGEEHELTTYVTVEVDMSAYELLEEIDDDELEDECRDRGIYIEPYKPFEEDPAQGITTEQLDRLIALVTANQDGTDDLFLLDDLNRLRFG